MENFKDKLSNYYNKFNEDKRLNHRHGQVEFITSMKYINEYLSTGDKIVDIGAGSGKYSIELKNKGYDVTAVELCWPNIGKIKVNDPQLKVVEANATDLSMFKDDEFDVAIMFGPMYHLIVLSVVIEFLRKLSVYSNLQGRTITLFRLFGAYLFILICINIGTSYFWLLIIKGALQHFDVRINPETREATRGPSLYTLLIDELTSTTEQSSLMVK